MFHVHCVRWPRPFFVPLNNRRQRRNFQSKLNATFISFAFCFVRHSVAIANEIQTEWTYKQQQQQRHKQLQQLILLKYLCLLFIKHSICQLKFINNCSLLFLFHYRFVFNLISPRPRPLWLPWVNAINFVEHINLRHNQNLPHATLHNYDELTNWTASLASPSLCLSLFAFVLRNCICIWQIVGLTVGGRGRRRWGIRTELHLVLA